MSLSPNAKLRCYILVGRLVGHFLLRVVDIDARGLGRVVFLAARCQRHGGQCHRGVCEAYQ